MKAKLPANVPQRTAVRSHYETASPDWPHGEALCFAAQNAFAEFALMHPESEAERDIASKRGGRRPSASDVGRSARRTN